MNNVELSEQEELTLDQVSVVDDWTKEPTTREELGRRVRLTMHDGTSFRSAVFAVLRNAERPPSVDPLVQALKDKIAAQRTAREETFLRLLEAKQRGNLPPDLAQRFTAAISRNPGKSRKETDGGGADGSSS
jgi:hypothetical protein